MSRTPNPERARWLRRCDYSINEITEAMCQEDRDVHPAEVTAWLNYATPPKLYELEGKRLTLSQVSKEVGVPLHLLRDRLARGLSLADAITRPAATPQQAARAADSPWRSHASCGGGTR
jgi:hypothetical protein